MSNKNDIKICGYEFNENLKETLKKEKSNQHKNIKKCWEDWPIVYMIRDENGKAYIGETSNTIKRMEDHLKDEKKKELGFVHMVLSDKFNKSVTLDLESHLIQLMHAEGYKLLNRNDGQHSHNYYNASEYRKEFEKIWNKLRRKGIVTSDYNELINSDMYKLSPYKTLDSTQYEIENQVIKQSLTTLLNEEEKSIVIEGGPGTGKSVLALHLIKRLIDLQQKRSEDEEDIQPDSEQDEHYKLMQELLKKKNPLKIGIVVPISQFRDTMTSVAKKVPGIKEDDVIGPYKLVYSDKIYNEQELNSIYKVTDENKYDILIVDEAHRLCRKNKTRSKYDKAFENEKTQYDWIKECSKVQIFFYDRYQTICTRDDEKIEEEFDKIKKEKKYYYKLKCQFRCLGGEDYINHLEKILEGKAKDKVDFKGKYEFYLFEDVDKMVKKIKKINNNKHKIVARNVAGYAWKWNPGEKDVLGKYVWNTKKEGWLHSENAINEIGCIHTVQGYDINYTGVIIGNDLKYEEGKGIYIDYDEYKDRTGKEFLRKNNPKDMQKLKEYITHIYMVLLTRGINGTYVYACDEGLRNYLKKVIETYKEN